jgi:hypothetical protein
MKPVWVMVEVEGTGPCPGVYSMIEIGAVAETGEEFHMHIFPTTDEYEEAALKAIGTTWEEVLNKQAHEAPEAMQKFKKWLTLLPGRPMFISDNNGFDWQYVNFYFWRYCQENPFGFSSTNLGSLYKGVVKDLRKNFKHLRKTKHDHNALNDARGNMEAFRKVLEMMG